MTPPSFHDRLHAVLQHPHKDATMQEVADLLGMERSSVNRAVRYGHLEAMKIMAGGCGKKCQLRITKAAIVKWMWDNTTGDRAVMRAELALHAPALLRLLETLHTAAALPPPANVLPFQRPRRARAVPHVDLFAGHPDLFDQAQ